MDGDFGSKRHDLSPSTVIRLAEEALYEIGNSAVLGSELDLEAFVEATWGGPSQFCSSLSGTHPGESRDMQVSESHWTTCADYDALLKATCLFSQLLSETHKGSEIHNPVAASTREQELSATLAAVASANKQWVSAILPPSTNVQRLSSEALTSFAQTLVKAVPVHTQSFFLSLLCECVLVQAALLSALVEGAAAFKSDGGNGRIKGAASTDFTISTPAPGCFTPADTLDLAASFFGMHSLPLDCRPRTLSDSIPLSFLSSKHLLLETGSRSNDAHSLLNLSDSAHPKLFEVLAEGPPPTMWSPRTSVDGLRVPQIDIDEILGPSTGLGRSAKSSELNAEKLQRVRARVIHLRKTATQRSDSCDLRPLWARTSRLMNIPGLCSASPQILVEWNILTVQRAHGVLKRLVSPPIEFPADAPLPLRIMVTFGKPRPDKGQPDPPGTTQEGLVVDMSILFTLPLRVVVRYRTLCGKPTMFVSERGVHDFFRSPWAGTPGTGSVTVGLPLPEVLSVGVCIEGTITPAAKQL